MHVAVWKSDDSLQEFSPSTMWVPGIELRSSIYTNNKNTCDHIHYWIFLWFTTANIYTGKEPSTSDLELYQMSQCQVSKCSL